MEQMENEILTWPGMHAILTSLENGTMVCRGKYILFQIKNDLAGKRKRNNDLNGGNNELERD